MTTTENHSTLHQTSRTSYRFDQVGLGYPTQEELDQVREAATTLLRGRNDRHPDCEPFTVLVDGEMLLEISRSGIHISAFSLNIFIFQKKMDLADKIVTFALSTIQ